MTPTRTIRGKLATKYVTPITYMYLLMHNLVRSHTHNTTNRKSTPKKNVERNLRDLSQDSGGLPQPFRERCRVHQAACCEAVDAAPLKLSLILGIALPLKWWWFVADYRYIIYCCTFYVIPYENVTICSPFVYVRATAVFFSLE